jgi:uncharacterized membrane protein
MDRPDVPPGWASNPSAWSHRLPVLGLALLGLAIATYLALHQWGITPNVWEPFFGDGSEVVLHSWVSQALPVPDAALGALAYLLDAAITLVGGTDRWRTRPWVVLAFGAVVAVAGITSILLIVAQPLLFHAWCTLCLASAAVSLALTAPALDEALASFDFLERVGAEGGSRWRAFWGLRQRPDGDRRAASHRIG